MGNPFSETDLILNKDGSVYHLGLKPEDIGNLIIFVGDPERVRTVSRYFDKVDFKKNNREFVTHTGYLNNLRISCISTGIGTDNIDIVMNELDALVNIDLQKREAKSTKTALKIVRIGTSGALVSDILVNSVLISKSAVAAGSLMKFYDYQPDLETYYLQNAFQQHLKKIIADVPGYAALASKSLLNLFGNKYALGCTYTAIGFYGPQGRQLNYKAKEASFLDKIATFRFIEHQLTNIEMETAGIYALGKLLGHHCLSVNVILANRVRKEFSKNAGDAIDRAIQDVLETITHY